MKDKVLNTLLEKTRNKKISLVTGNFNYVHSGHLRLFKFAKNLADVLIILVNKDSRNLTFLSQKDRLNKLRKVMFLDHCFPIETSINDLIIKIKPNYLIKGNEYQDLYNPEEKILKKNGGRLIFFSSSYQDEKQLLNNKNKKKNNFFKIPETYIQNHQISIMKLVKVLNKINKLKVLVVGDLIIDRYINCLPIGMSRESPNIVFKHIESNDYIGGGAITSAHAKALNTDVTFLSISGNDKYYAYAQKELKKLNINSRIFKDESRPTTLKKKYIYNNNTLFRLNQLKDHQIEKLIENAIIDEIKKKKYDLIAVSDFNYGLITPKVIDTIRNKGVFISGDCQTSSQIGDIKKFKNFNLITPTELEARYSLHDNHSGLVQIAHKLQKHTRSKNIILTLGDQGILINTKYKNKFFTDQIEALNKNPVNISGAGDCFFVVVSICLTLNLNIWESALIGSIASAHQISEKGNVPVKITSIIENLNYYEKISV